MNELIPTAEYDVLPFQIAPEGDVSHIYRFSDVTADYLYTPRRHQFDLVLWVTKGTGRQMIDANEYHMDTGKLYFVRQGQMHKISEYAEDGWMILLSSESSKGFNSVLMDYFYQRPFLDIKELRCETFMGLFSLLQVEAGRYSKNGKMIVNFLNGMLLCAERCESFADISISENLRMVKTLKGLIDENFRIEKEEEFYSSSLGLSRRNIIKVIRPLLGKTIHELIQDRVLTESKLLLKKSGMSINEISEELGFSSASYFCVFFKKMTGITPNEYRFKI